MQVMKEAIFVEKKYINVATFISRQRKHLLFMFIFFVFFKWHEKCQDGWFEKVWDESRENPSE